MTTDSTDPKFVTGKIMGNAVEPVADPTAPLKVDPDLIAYWKTLPKPSNEYLAAELLESQQRELSRCREGLADALILLSAHAEREGGICNCGTLTDRHAAACPAAPSAASGLDELANELERCSEEIWDALPDGESGIREITVSVSKLSAYIDVLTDAKEAIRSHQAPVGEEGCPKCGGTGWLHGAQEWTPERMSKGTPYKSVRCDCAHPPKDSNAE